MQKEEIGGDISTMTRNTIGRFIKLKTNPVYYAIERLVNEKSEVLKPYNLKCVKNFNNNVYYIEFSDTPTYQIYGSTYKFTERHLTIHEHFKDNANGLSFAHYTERYRQNNGGTVVIHVYFDRHAYYLDIQIKQHADEQKNGNGIKLAVHPDIEELIRKNSEKANELLQCLIVETEKFHVSALARAKKIEQSLTLISKQLKQNSIQGYIEKGSKYIDAIAEANKYASQGHDKRGSLMAKQIAFLTSLNIAAENDTQVEDKQSMSEHLIAATIPTNQNKSAMADFIHIINEVEKLKIQNANIVAEPSEVSQVINRCRKTKEIQLQLLALSAKFNLIPEKDRTQLNDLLIALEIDANLLPLFKKVFWEGNVEAVKELYSYIEDRLDFKFFIKDIFTKFIESPPNKEQEPAFTAVFNFLYKKSPNYRSMVKSSFLLPGADYFYSLLASAAYHDNLFAFKLLLEHGANPNGIGAIVNKVKIPNIFVLNILMMTPTPVKLIYLELLIEAGATYTCNVQPLVKNDPGTSINIGFFDSTKDIIGHMQKIIKTYCKDFETTIKDLMACGDFIVWCLLNHQYEVIELNVSKLTLRECLVCLAILTRETDVIHLAFSSNPGCKVVNDYQEAISLSKEIKSSVGRFYTLIFVMNGDHKRQSLLEKLIKNIHEKRRELQTTHPDLLQKLHSDLYKTGVSKQYSDPACFTTLMGCIYFLTFDPEPTARTYEQIMQLYCHKAVFHKKLGISLNHNCYDAAYEIATESRFSEALQKTPLFQFIIKNRQTKPNDPSPSQKILLQK